MSFLFFSGNGIAKWRVVSGQLMLLMGCDVKGKGMVNSYHEGMILGRILS
jgi:hypothetical protein